MLLSCVLCLVAQLGPTLCDPVHGIFPARILEWLAISFYRRSSPPMDQTCVSSVSCIDLRFFTPEQLGKPIIEGSCSLISEKATAPHSSTLAENPMDGGAWWAAVHGVAEGQTRLSDFTFMHWRRKWQPTPVFLPGESQGQRSLVGCRLRGRTESDTTEVT